MLLYPTETIAEAKMMLLYPTKPPSETKMVLPYPTKTSRRQKWCYCTLRNHRGDQNDVTVPYSNAIRDQNSATERLKMAAETKMALLSGSIPSRRQKWRY